jgi:hypothetical protein
MLTRSIKLNWLLFSCSTVLISIWSGASNLRDYRNDWVVGSEKQLVTVNSPADQRGTNKFSETERRVLTWGS